MPASNSTKFCNRCGIQKALDEFDVHLYSRDGRKYECKECILARFVTKVCTRCGIEKPRSEFYKEKRSKTSGLISSCKACFNERSNQKVRALDPLQREGAREKTREAQFKCRYGINRVGYGRLLALQGGRCAICHAKKSQGKRTEKLYIDHDHDTGYVRGLICRRCNAALGAFGDDLKGIMRVVKYLKDAEKSRIASLAPKVANEDASSEETFALTME